MCEYCGCQALETIDELTQEHNEVIRLISRLRFAHQSGDTIRMAETAREIARELGAYTQVEEHDLSPALAGDFPAMPRDHILKEQDGIFPAALANLRRATRPSQRGRGDTPLHGCSPGPQRPPTSGINGCRMRSWLRMGDVFTRAGGPVPVRAPPARPVALPQTCTALRRPGAALSGTALHPGRAPHWPTGCEATRRSTPSSWRSGRPGAATSRDDMTHHDPARGPRRPPRGGTACPPRCHRPTRRTPRAMKRTG